MSSTINTPRYIQGERVSDHNAREEGIPHALTPTRVGNVCGKQTPYEYNEWYVEPALEFDQWVFFQITHVDGLSLFDDVGMFSAQKPTDVREEEAPFGVVWVGIRLRELVMDAMVATPLVYVVFQGQDVHECQQ